MNALSRRDFLRQAGWLSAQGVLCGTGLVYTNLSLAQHETGKAVDGVKAMVFDVFGTLVDWRTCVARESRDRGTPPTRSSTRPASSAPQVHAGAVL